MKQRKVSFLCSALIVSFLFSVYAPLFGDSRFKQSTTSTTTSTSTTKTPTSKSTTGSGNLGTLLKAAKAKIKTGDWAGVEKALSDAKKAAKGSTSEIASLQKEASLAIAKGIKSYVSKVDSKISGKKMSKKDAQESIAWLQKNLKYLKRLGGNSYSKFVSDVEKKIIQLQKIAAGMPKQPSSPQPTGGPSPAPGPTVSENIGTLGKIIKDFLGIYNKMLEESKSYKALGVISRMQEMGNGLKIIQTELSNNPADALKVSAAYATVLKGFCETLQELAKLAASALTKLANNPNDPEAKALLNFVKARFKDSVGMAEKLSAFAEKAGKFARGLEVATGLIQIVNGLKTIYNARTENLAGGDLLTFLKDFNSGVIDIGEGIAAISQNPLLTGLFGVARFFQDNNGFADSAAAQYVFSAAYKRANAEGKESVIKDFADSAYKMWSTRFLGTNKAISHSLRASFKEGFQYVLEKWKESGKDITVPAGRDDVLNPFSTILEKYLRIKNNPSGLADWKKTPHGKLFYGIYPNGIPYTELIKYGLGKQ
ncbi:hypothetical protein HYY75_02990 [bacterium]|nr:hypothetical protein [bacterium]